MPEKGPINGQIMLNVLAKGAEKVENGWKNLMEKYPVVDKINTFMFGHTDDWYREHGMVKPYTGMGAAGLVSPESTLGVMNDFKGVSNIVKGNFGFNGVKPNLGLTALKTEKRAMQLARSYEAQQKRNEVALKYYKKAWRNFFIEKFVIFFKITEMNIW